MDGAYALYPGGEPRSGYAEYVAITETCHALGMGVTVHTPQATWQGNEVEKRASMFRLAETVADPDDWYFVMDGDQVITHPPHDLKARLKATDLDVAEVRFWERHPPNTEAEQAKFRWDDHEFNVRILFRAIPGLTVRTNHYTYVTPDGTVLWGGAQDEQVEALDLTDLRVEHRTNFRPVARREDRLRYYQTRDKLGLEVGKCQRCDKPAKKTLSTNPRINDHGQVEGEFIDVCPHHAVDVRLETAAQLKALGVAAPQSEFKPVKQAA